MWKFGLKFLIESIYFNVLIWELVQPKDLQPWGRNTSPNGVFQWKKPPKSRQSISLQKPQFTHTVGLWVAAE